MSQTAQDVIRCESAGLAALSTTLQETDDFDHALATILEADRVIITGMGKSGHVGAKIAATLSSTGTPAYFLHPSEAGHGDLGMIQNADCVIAISWSGESAELSAVVQHTRRFQIPLIAVTSAPTSSLGRAADVLMRMPTTQEACPMGLAPTTSTTMTMVLGDCLAVSLAEARGFTSERFAALHPSGKLGAQLTQVEDIMHEEDLPLVRFDTSVRETILKMSAGRFGCVGVMKDERLLGIVTDGDLRRHMDDEHLLFSRAAQIMTRNPKVLAAHNLAANALEQMNTMEITAMFVTEGETPIGIVHVHDLLRAGVA